MLRAVAFCTRACVNFKSSGTVQLLTIICNDISPFYNIQIFPHTYTWMQATIVLCTGQIKTPTSMTIRNELTRIGLGHWLGDTSYITHMHPPITPSFTHMHTHTTHAHAYTPICIHIYTHLTWGQIHENLYSSTSSTYLRILLLYSTNLLEHK